MATRVSDEGFANPKFVLIHGEYWRSNENRRPILVQAWVTEFADILLKDIIQKSEFKPNSNKIKKHNIAHKKPDEEKPIENKGAHDVVVHLSAYVGNYLGISDANKLKNSLIEVKKVRNIATHERISNCNMLKEMLEAMKQFCQLLGKLENLDVSFNPATNRVNHFKQQCETEIERLINNETMY